MTFTVQHIGDNQHFEHTGDVVIRGDIGANAVITVTDGDLAVRGDIAAGVKITLKSTNSAGNQFFTTNRMLALSGDVGVNVVLKTSNTDIRLSRNGFQQCFAGTSKGISIAENGTIIQCFSGSLALNPDEDLAAAFRAESLRNYMEAKVSSNPACEDMYQALLPYLEAEGYTKQSFMNFKNATADFMIRSMFINAFEMQLLTIHDLEGMKFEAVEVTRYVLENTPYLFTDSSFVEALKRDDFDHATFMREGLSERWHQIREQSSEEKMTEIEHAGFDERSIEGGITKDDPRLVQQREALSDVIKKYGRLDNDDDEFQPFCAIS